MPGIRPRWEKSQLAAWKTTHGPCKACANVWELIERRVWDSKSERGRNHDALCRFAFHYATLLHKQSHNDGSNVNNTEMLARVHGPGHVVLVTCVYSVGGVFMKFAKKAASKAFVNETHIHLLLRRDFWHFVEARSIITVYLHKYKVKVIPIALADMDLFCRIKAFLWNDLYLVII